VLLKKTALAFLICLLPQVAFAISDASDFLIIPSAEIVGDKSFQVRETVGHSKADKFPFISSFRLGLFNSFELGVQLGSTVSLDMKTQINKNYDFIPAFAFGARAFVQSPEAYFYSVPKSERKDQTGEFYTVAQWGGSLWKLLGGVSLFPLMDADAVAPLWGYEQGLGTQKFSLLYEGFFRHGFSHHNIGFSFKPVRALQISAGATEFYRYFLKEKHTSTGYHIPGIYASVAISIGPKTSISEKDDVDSLRRQLMAQEAELANVRSRVEVLESEKTNSSIYAKLRGDFLEIVKGYKADVFSPDSMLSKEQSFMDRGPVAKNFILKEAQDDTSAQENRITAIRIMSHFPDSTFLEPLGKLVSDGSNEAVAREAALALGTINTPESRKVLSTVANQTKGIVRETIVQIMGTL